MMKCLKVEDALSYLDQVKARFAGQGAIYTDFLDVMREFKTQTIGTEAVIRRVRELFEGHPDLIVGFNTFIPQGYRMDAPIPRISSTGSGRSALAVSALDHVSPIKTYNTNVKSADGSNEWCNSTSLPSSVVGQHETRPGSGYTPATGPPISGSPSSRSQISDTTTYSSATQQTLLGSNYQENYPATLSRGPYSTASSVCTQPPLSSHVYQQQQQAQSFNHALLYVNKIKNRFQGIPDAYKRFLDILQWYQREQRHSDPLRRKQAELQVYQDVAKLFDGQEDLLQEFSQFLPESTGVTNAVTESIIGRKLSGHIQSSGIDQTVSDIPVSVPQTISRVPEVVTATPAASRQRHELPSTGNMVSTTQHTLNSDVKKLKRLAPTPSVPCSVSLNQAITPTTTNSVVGVAAKKPRSNIRDVSIADVNQLTTGLDAALLHKIRVSLDADGVSGERSYETFKHIVSLFGRNMLTVEELLEATRPLFPRHSDVWKRFCDMITLASPSSNSELGNTLGIQSSDLRDKEKQDRDKRGLSEAGSSLYEDSHTDPSASGHVLSTSTLSGFAEDAAQKRLDLDFSKLRLCGTSYRALPSNFPQSKCSGRQKCPIAKEVLNDSFISFSSLTSEDSQFVSSKKNQYEENMYRVEDERYEVDMVTELNRATMQNLVVVKRKMDNMKREELAQFQLDDNLSGTSAILMRKAIHRVYGDKAGDVIYGLKNCPSTVVPLVIQRMRQKDTEWREAIRGYQRSWADQDARNYLRSLDHQGATFKQRDAPLIRSKTMVSQIEAIAKDDKPCHAIVDPVGTMISASVTQHCLTTRTDLTSPGTIGSALINVNEGYKEPGAPHLALVYPPPVVRNALLEDAASLIIHHVKRQSNTSKEDKRTMKYLIRTVVQDIFMADRFPMSDDEEEEEEDGADEFDQKDDEDTIRDDQGENVDSYSRTRGGATQISRKSRDRDADSFSATRTTSRSKLDEDTKPDLGSSRSPSTETPNSVNCDGDPRIASMDADAENYQQQQPGPGSDPSTSSRGAFAYRGKQAAAGLGSHPTELSCGINFPREEHYSLLYGNNHWYAFIRLHHLLLCRLHVFRSRTAESSSATQSSDKKDPPVQAAELLRFRRCGTTITTRGVEPSDYYNRALNLVKDLLDGGEDIATYEDRLRDMFGIYAYPWFTLDRLVINIVRQLQALASGDELSRRLTNLYRSWTCGANYSASGGTPSVSHRFNHVSGSVVPTATGGPSVNFPQLSGIRGPLCTRVCRMANEATYRTQALNVCSEFAGLSGSNANLSNNAPSSTHPSAQTNGNSVTSASSQTLPNCYALVMLNEASTMLIRLISPTACPSSCDASDTLPPACMMHYMTHWPTCMAQPSSSSLASSENATTAVFHQTPARHWSDYLYAHLMWTSGYMPHNVATHIRPVFLYRTVRRCVNTLTRRAYRRRQQQLVETGDTQPEELLMKASQAVATSSGNSGDEASDAGETDDRQEGSVYYSKNGNNAKNFEHDVWEFMCHVFKSDLTRRELFRDTYSSDCMQSTNRLTSKVNARAHKINWSVGSYGIFVRRKQKTTSNYPSTDKWREFHSRWFAEHQPNETTEVVQSSQLDSSRVPAQIYTTPGCRTTQDLYKKEEGGTDSSPSYSDSTRTGPANASEPTAASTDTTDSTVADNSTCQSVLTVSTDDTDVASAAKMTVTESDPVTD